jgi:hypothetical protein
LGLGDPIGHASRPYPPLDHGHRDKKDKETK